MSGAKAPAFEWPIEPNVEAPPRVSGQLVTWSTYKGFGAEHGLLAWIGGVRIGRIGINRDGTGDWWCSLPADEDVLIGGNNTVDLCKTNIETMAKSWLETAGLAQVET